MAWPFLPVNPECGASPCNPTPTTSDLLTYAGPNLPCTGINSCDTLSVSLQKIDEVICVLQATPVVNPAGSPLTTKGDLFTFDTDNQRLGVGADGLFLKANSSTPTGLEYTNVTMADIFATNPTASYAASYPLTAIDINMGTVGDGFFIFSISDTTTGNSYSGIDTFADGLYLSHRKGNLSSNMSAIELYDDVIDLRLTVLGQYSSFKIGIPTVRTTFILPSPTVDLAQRYIPISVDGNFADASGNITITTTSTTTAIPEGIINNIYKVKVHFTSLEIEALNATPVNIISSPGAGKAIVILKVFAAFNFVSVPFLDRRMEVGLTPSGNQYYSPNFFLSLATNHITTFYEQAGNGIILENYPIIVSINSPTGTGDCTVDLYLTYEIITL